MRLFVCDPKSGKLMAWGPRFERSDPKYSPLGVWALVEHREMLVVGGDFTKVNGEGRERVAVFGTKTSSNK